MSDYADRYTDKKISQVDRELRKTYRTAQKELKQKLADFNKRFAEKSKVMKERLKNGEITKDDYRDWLTGQVFVRSKWQSQIKAINGVLLDHNKQAINIINNGTLDVFAENYNYAAWKAESEIAASFTIYNAESVARLILGDPQLLPEWKINEKKDYQWNYDKVNNIVRQAIIQGKGVEEITKNLCERLSSTNESKMRMFARTALGSAQNAGRQAQMDDAVEMGIEVNKRWVATHDGVTRDSHRALDGEEVPENQPFSNGLMFPKDPKGAPEEIYNCRCRMVAIYPKYEDRTEPDYTEGMIIDGQSYREWKKFDNYADWKKWKEEQQKGKVENKTPERVNEGLMDDVRGKLVDYEATIKAHEKRIEQFENEYKDLYGESLIKYGTEEYNNVVERMGEVEAQIAGEREKIDEIKQDRVAYLAQDGKELLIEAFGKINGEHSMQQDTLSVNRITADDRSQKNCGSCCLAYDARRRGIDCQAELTYGINNNVIESWWDGIKMQNVASYYPSDAMKAIEGIVESWGEGARAIIDIGTTETTGHYIMCEVKDGKCRFNDAQSGIVDANFVFDIARNGNIRYGRTDDKPITKNAIMYLRGGSVEQD